MPADRKEPDYLFILHPKYPKSPDFFFVRENEYKFALKKLFIFF